MATTLTTHDTILQENYVPGVTTVLNTKTPIMNRFPISKRKFDGRRIRELVNHRRPAGGGAMGPSAPSVPDASRSGNTETFIFHCYIYDSIQIDWDLEAQSGGSHSYLDAVAQELKGVAEFRLVDFERMMLGDGSGFLGLSSITVTSTSPLTFTVPTLGMDPLFEEGMRIEAWSTRTSAAVKRDVPAQGFYEIATKSRADGTTTITCTAASVAPGAGNDPQTGDFVAKDEAIVENNTDGGLNSSNELVGLRGFCDDGNHVSLTNTKAGFPADATFQGINATTNSWWQALVADGTGQYLNVDLVQQVADDIATHGGGDPGQIRFMVTSHFQRRKYLQSMYPQERFPNSGTAGSFNAGSQYTFDPDAGPDVGKRAMIVSRFCAPGEAYLVGGGIEHYDLKPWGFWSGDGSMWTRNLNGRPARFATAYCYKAVGCKSRNNHGRIESLSTS